jgi:hypothetical protein
MTTEPLRPGAKAALRAADIDGIIPPVCRNGNGPYKSSDLQQLHRLQMAGPHKKRVDGLWFYKLHPAGRAARAELDQAA